jgi:hypothetical protein
VVTGQQSSRMHGFCSLTAEVGGIPAEPLLRALYGAALGTARVPRL